jgi:hypothetical protein
MEFMAQAHQSTKPSEFDLVNARRLFCNDSKLPQTQHYEIAPGLPAIGMMLFAWLIPECRWWQSPQPTKPQNEGKNWGKLIAAYGSNPRFHWS